MKQLIFLTALLLIPFLMNAQDGNETDNPTIQSYGEAAGTSGSWSTFMGTRAGSNNSGTYNTFIGNSAGRLNTAGTKNTYLGASAGRVSGGSGNVFIGYNAGYNETGSNKLYIDNSLTPLPLIYGDFQDNYVIINGGETTVSSVSDLSDYALYVTKGILTEKVKVAKVEDWADYVFAEDYKLNTIEEVENFIEENKHLPNVPSAAEVSENGVDMVEMDATLLRQIEELWLHVIEMNKENKQQPSPTAEDIEDTDNNTTELDAKLLNQIEELQSQITELKKHVTELEIQLEQK